MGNLELLTGSEREALEYLYGGGDEEIECRSMTWVKTRYPQMCVSIMHTGEMVQPAGTRMILERAKVEGKFGSCYTCESCIKKAEQELNHER
jgi:hypothetical protein